MCGIVGYIGPKDPVDVLVEGLRRLEYRGYDSAGVAVVDDDGQLLLRRAEGKLRDLERVIAEHPLDGRYGLGHTRWATHGRPSEENAHPHRDCSGRLVVIQHEFGIETRYAHNTRIRVTKGQRVSRGDHIADMGSTGRSTGTHLHYEIRVNKRPVNPMTYIKAAKDVF